MICPACNKAPCAQGCTKCDACIDHENRLWQEVLATRRERIAIATALRSAELRERNALDAFREVSNTTESRALATTILTGMLTRAQAG